MYNKNILCLIETTKSKGDFMYADENVIKIKHAVLHEVAKLAFEGTLDAERDHIAVRLIPGPDTTVPLLYLQRKRNYPPACPSCRGQSPGTGG